MTLPELPRDGTVQTFRHGEAWYLPRGSGASAQCAVLVTSQTHANRIARMQMLAAEPYGTYYTQQADWLGQALVMPYSKRRWRRCYFILSGKWVRLGTARA